MTTPIKIGMAMDEFIRRQGEDGPFELINGEIVPKIPTGSQHTKTVKRLFMALMVFEQKGVGEAFSETTFVLTDTPQWVKGSRIPDVMFVKQEKIEKFESEIPDSAHKPYILVPDLVVEVISPTDKYGDVTAKIDGYLRDGVQIAWLADPDAQKVTIYTQGSNIQTTLFKDDTLDGGTVLPDFKLPLTELFS